MSAPVFGVVSVDSKLVKLTTYSDKEKDLSVKIEDFAKNFRLTFKQYIEPRWRPQELLVEDFTNRRSKDPDGKIAENYMQFYTFETLNETDNNMVLVSQQGEKLMSYRNEAAHSFSPATVTFMLFDKDNNFKECKQSQKFDNFLKSGKDLLPKMQYTLCLIFQWPDNCND